MSSQLLNEQSLSDIKRLKGIQGSGCPRANESFCSYGNSSSIQNAWVFSTFRTYVYFRSPCGLPASSCVESPVTWVTGTGTAVAFFPSCIGLLIDSTCKGNEFFPSKSILKNNCLLILFLLLLLLLLRDEVGSEITQNLGLGTCSLKKWEVRCP